jgi:DNA polymerase
LKAKPIRPDAANPRPQVPTALVDLLERAACHTDPNGHALMYRLLWRVVHGRRTLLHDAADGDVMAVTRLAKAVDRASHKMKAFVRFRELHTAQGLRYVGWFEPAHDVLQRTAPFFARRFASLLWTIVTPGGGVRWDGNALCFFDVEHGLVLPDHDAAESLWLTYYESIFNPARLNVSMMRKEMPIAYWRNLPEAARIPALVAKAMPRAGRMIEEQMPRGTNPCRKVAIPADPPTFAPGQWPAKTALDTCRRCPLGERATQGVAGEGPPDARLMLIGEQPGDEEDLAGKPFVGPAGKLLRRALRDADLDPAALYITNAVKHFSYEPRGKRRVHKTPVQREIEACRAWLDAEIDRVRPDVIVALGASALSALLRTRVPVATARQQVLVHTSGARIVATYHPSAVLRDADEDAKAARYATLVDDLRAAALRLHDGVAKAEIV